VATKNGKPANGENIARAVTEVSERVSVLVREELELAKVEVTRKVTSIAKGAVAVGAGAVFGVFVVIFGLMALAWGISDPGRRGREHLDRLCRSGRDHARAGDRGIHLRLAQAPRRRSQA
jgi:hypothetical protein